MDAEVGGWARMTGRAHASGLGVCVSSDLFASYASEVEHIRDRAEPKRATRSDRTEEKGREEGVQA